MSPASQRAGKLKDEQSGDSVNIVSKPSLDLPVEHPTMDSGSSWPVAWDWPGLLTHNCKMLPSLVVLQGPRAVPLSGEGISVAGCSPRPAPPVCRGTKPSQPFQKCFLRNQRLPDLGLPLASFRLCTGALPFPLILFLTDGKSFISQNPSMAGVGREP